MSKILYTNTDIERHNNQAPYIDTYVMISPNSFQRYLSTIIAFTAVYRSADFFFQLKLVTKTREFL